MRKLIAIFAVMFVWTVAPVAAQDYLPQTLGPLNSSSSQLLTASQIDQLAGQDAPLLREYGLTFAERRTYGEGAQEIRVTLFRFRDSTSAYGAYSFYGTQGFGDSFAAGASRAGGTHEASLLGNLIFEVSSKTLGPSREALRELQRKLLARADAAPYPMLIQYFPTEGLVKGSERYVLGPLGLYRALPLEKGDWVGFDAGAEAQAAKFRTNGTDTTLLLIAYPTPQAAQRKLVELGRWFNVNATEKAPTTRPTVYARRILSILAIASQTDSAESANALLGKVNYQPTFSWNEPGHRASEPPLVQMIYSIFVGTGIILAFAFVAGVSFGGLRLIVKLLLPGKIFDRPKSIEILQLGLGSKPIQAKDFY